jgi:hypothetical protein
METPKSDKKADGGPATVVVVGMVWYSLEHFDEIKSMMEDGHKLQRTYAEWRLSTEQGERQLRRQDQFVVRAHLVPDAFRQFCAERGLRLNSKARNDFASFIALQEYSKTQ